MFSPKSLLFILCSINYVLYVYGAAQQVNGSLYIPGVPLVGGLEPGEIVVAELVGTDGEASTFALFDSIPTTVSGIKTRTTATFTLVSAPTGILLTADVDRDLGANDIEEKIHTECFIDGSGESLCRDIIVDVVNHEKTVTITSLFSEMTSAVPVVAIGFGVITSGTSNTSTSSSSSSTISPLSSGTTSTSPTPTPSVPSPTSSDDGAVTVTLTSSSINPLSNSASSFFAQRLLSLIFIALATTACFI